MEDQRDEISTEADRIGESCELSSLQHFIAAKCWRRMHLVMGIAATIGATISTALTFSTNETLLSGLFALGVAILAGLMTFLNPQDRADQHHEKGVDYQQIVANTRMFVNIHLPNAGTEEDFTPQLQNLSDQKFGLDRTSPVTPAGMFYYLAKKSIDSGETSFRTDKDRQKANVGD